MTAMINIAVSDSGHYIALSLPPYLYTHDDRAQQEPLAAIRCSALL